MTSTLRIVISNGLGALLLGALLLGALAGCAAPADARLDESSYASSLDGTWQLVDSDLQPATSYSIDGDAIDLHWGGYYSWNGSWATGFRGYTFAQPAALVEGATYQLTLTASDASNPIPVVLRATLSGADAEQSATIFGGNGSATMSFTIASSPGDLPEVTLTAHPALGHIGPLDHLGVLFQSYRVTAALVRTN